MSAGLTLGRHGGPFTSWGRVFAKAGKSSQCLAGILVVIEELFGTFEATAPGVCVVELGRGPDKEAVGECQP